MIMVLKQVK